MSLATIETKPYQARHAYDRISSLHAVVPSVDDGLLLLVMIMIALIDRTADARF